MIRKKRQMKEARLSFVLFHDEFLLTALPIFKGNLKAYKRQKLCNFHIKDLPFAFRGIYLLRERHLYLLKVIFFKIY